MATELTLNGAPVKIDAPPDTPLLWAIREGAGLTGTKYGCGIAYCGACTVHVDGLPMRSCQAYLGDLEGARVTTIEGAGGAIAQAVRTAWRELDVVQCGYCQSGQIMSAIGLLTQTPRPSDAQIDAYMSGNVCRCATYQRIRAAIHRAARLTEA
ncbi:MAG: (2Fe-2S)-binding protein [Alphaproteobacteria bacterium]|nr:(2Fe-2S)-binding protein [Alphaproteobacteria bacterium]